MTLTALRRIVLACDLAALLAAGASGWYSFQATPAEARDWQKLFPVKSSATSDVQDLGPGPKEEYTASITWPQGERPVEVKPDNTPPPPKVDPFKTKYHLNGVFLGRYPFNSFVQLTAEGVDRAFSVGVGERIAQDPTALQSPPQLTPWRLNSVRAGGWDAKGLPLPCVAVFQNMETFQEQTLDMIAGNAVALDNPNDEKKPGIGQEDPSGKRPKDQPMRAVPIRIDVAAGVVEWEVPDSEIEWLGDWGEDQAHSISIVESKDSAGRPDGFTLKAVAPGSRAAEYGFKPEDKVISVNSQPVSSVTDAIAKGKQQYDNGANVFQIKALRAGKEVNFTFHAPPPKKKRQAP
jgi:hypothetical protein